MTTSSGLTGDSLVEQYATINLGEEDEGISSYVAIPEEGVLSIISGVWWEDS